jgi:hypothetical protein
MGELSWAAYEPPTAEQLERRTHIRDNIERLSVRPLRDTLHLDNNVRRVRVTDKSGMVAVVLLTAALAVTVLWGLL